MATTTTNAQQLLQNFDDELAKLYARLHAIEKACGYGVTVTTNTSSSPLLPNKAPIINFGATIAANSRSNPLLPDIAKPSLPAAPRSEDAASHVTAGHLHSDLASKIGDNDDRHNDEYPCHKKIPSAPTTTTTPPTPQPPLLLCLPMLGPHPASPVAVQPASVGR
jgi:hypothetical protein